MAIDGRRNSGQFGQLRSGGGIPAVSLRYPCGIPLRYRPSRSQTPAEIAPKKEAYRVWQPGFRRPESL